MCELNGNFKVYVLVLIQKETNILDVGNFCRKSTELPKIFIRQT